jgi:hypothetical protein
MENTSNYRTLSLQLFAEGGGDAGGDTGVDGTAGVKQISGVSGSKITAESKNPLAGVVYGKQDVGDRPADGRAKLTDSDGNSVQTEDREAEFEKLIKGDYKDLYDRRVQETIQKRLKNTREIVDKYEKLSPTLQMLSSKYGVDASDIEALNKAIEEDDTYYEDEAVERGITVEQLKAIRKMERENTQLKAKIESQHAQENAKRIYAGWLEQAAAAKTKYPALDLEAEIKNPKFADLLRSGIDVDTAYTVVHKDELIPAAMQYTAKTVEQKLTNKILANGARPNENGTDSRSSAVIKSDVSQLSKQDRAEIIRRVARGEKIRF